MNIDLRQLNTIEGSYGCIVLDPTRGFAYKVFRNKSDRTRKQVESVFRAEVRAYEIAVRTPELRNYIPRFFGKLKIESMRDRDGKDLDSSLHLDLAYKMELISGLFIKLAEPSVSAEDSAHVRELFAKAGIEHLADASVTLKPDDSIDKIVDFATSEFELFHTH